jgi:urea transport system permease protein
MSRLVLLLLVLAGAGFGWLPGLHSALVAAETAPADPVAALLSGLAASDRPGRIAAIQALAKARDPRLVAFLEDYRQGSAYLQAGAVVLVPVIKAKVGIPLDPLTRQPLSAAVPESSLTALDVSGPERKAAIAAITLLRLTDPDPVVRLAAVSKAGDGGGATNRAALAEVAKDEAVPAVRRAATEGIALIDLAEGDEPAKAHAITTLGDLCSLRARDQLEAIATVAGPHQAAAAAALERIHGHQSTVHLVQIAFSGLSAGSILVLMALGLSITFGLMGVINMAHGEMMMLGAYATLLVQWGFERFLPASLLPWYFVVGIFAGFIAAGIAGWLLELLVIRHLYGRPLETLLATWGISYLLIQTIRTIFGDNQAVTAPPYLVGGWEPIPDLVLPYNRLFIIATTLVSVAAVVTLMRGTRLGLLLRATVQSRRTAASLGVDTRRIDGLTFAFGSGLAGAAGCAITLIGGLKPDMGQEFIIDSFLVVATGGVGNLAGVCCAGLGLGVLNKLLEPVTQAVFAKVLMLLAVIVFLQFRSQGIFPPKGRLADG